VLETLSPSQQTAFARYADELLAWNEHTNLTAIRSREEIYRKHFEDSLTCIQAWGEQPPHHLIDIGAGAGFPGLPLKIVYPAMQLTLVESVAKKTAFCQHIVTLLGLEGVTILAERAETLAQQPQHREQYDWAVARAVASLPVLAEYLLPFVRLGGHMLAQKGTLTQTQVELQAAANAIHTLGGNLRTVLPVQAAGLEEERCLVIIRKAAPTPARYPRRPGMPTKKPL